MITIGKKIEKHIENDIEARTDERVESDAQLEVWELGWTKVRVRFWSNDPIIERINA